MLISFLLLFIQAPATDSLPQFAWPVENAAATLGEDVSLTLKHHTVDLDYGLLFSTAKGGVSSFSLTLEAGLTVTVDFESREEAPDGFCWSGTLREDAEGSATFALVEDKVTASVVFQDRLFRISCAGAGLHYIAELDSSAFPSCATSAAHAINLPTGKQGNGHRGTGNPDVDVMVVYTTKAKNNQGGTTAMQSLINLAVTETNAAYQKSDVNQRLVLVYSQEEVGYTENGDFGTELNRIRKKNDGHMDDVHALRDEYGADLVCLIVGGSQYCGIAYLMTNVSNGFEDYAFSVVSRSCATGYYSFGHELGHNMGCTHDHQNASSGAYSYSFGWRTSNNAYRTIMAYSPGSRIKYFSNHNKNKNGYPLGQVNYAENWRSLNNTADTVAGWRDTAVEPFELTHTTLLRGLTAVFATTGADAGERVWFLGGPNSGSLFPPQLGGLGIDIGNPVTILGSGFSNSAGEASVNFFLPSSLPAIPVYLQAVIVRGTGGSNSIKTDLVTSQIY